MERHASKRPKIWLYVGIACVIAVITILARRAEQNARSGRAAGRLDEPARGGQPQFEPGDQNPAGDLRGAARTWTARGPRPQLPAGGPTARGEGPTPPERMAPEMLDECFRAEQRDEAWATATEPRLRDFIARQPYGNTFDVSSVECRTSLCEIHASSEAPVELSDPQGALSPATWRSLVLNVRQDVGLASEFEERGLLPTTWVGENAGHKATLVRRSSAVPDDRRCGGDGEEALRARALKGVTGGSPGDEAQGLPPLSEENHRFCIQAGGVLRGRGARRDVGHGDGGLATRGPRRSRFDSCLERYVDRVPHHVMSGSRIDRPRGGGRRVQGGHRCSEPRVLGSSD